MAEEDGIGPENRRKTSLRQKASRSQRLDLDKKLMTREQQRGKKARGGHFSVTGKERSD